MAPHRHLTWRALVIGLVAIGVLAGAALWVLAFARVDALHGDRYHLTLLTADASRIIQGTDVWLEGQKVGRVASVHLRPIATDPADRVAVELELLREYQPQIRANSRAELGHAGSPIGAPVIMLSVGTTAAPMLTDGDTLLAPPKTSRQQLVDKLSDATDQLPHFVANIHDIIHDLHRTSDAVNALPPAKTAGLAALTRRAAKRIAMFDRRASNDSRERPRAVNANGRSDGMRAQAEHLASDLRSVATTATSTRGTISALQHDTALGVTLRDVSRQLSVIGSLLGESRGSAGRFLNDSAIAHQLHRNR